MELEQKAIREHAGRIVSSPEFASVPRLQRFLAFVVETSLAGRAGEIKETLVGVEVYGRPPDYNPQLDATVRVEAGRLRARLRQYYEGSGRAEPICRAERTLRDSNGGSPRRQPNSVRPRERALPCWLRRGAPQRSWPAPWHRRFRGPAHLPMQQTPDLWNSSSARDNC
jgi:hypothetical protein